ncbi:MAG: S-isoprenylcysteine methyltransferase [Candidatus Omnitrophica bacterium]|nr:S-isoprenylcysteine methyltransferase [Candidatus Omnitrophota bacterium]
MTTIHRWNVAAGQFLFRYRNALFPVMFALAILAMRPRLLFGNPALDRAFVVGGTLIALAGEGTRLLTIGYDYIERGGKNKQVYASRLVHRGMYALTRNPMYLGNLLMTVGVVMAIGSPSAYGVVIPAFAFVYQAITCAEEAYLLNRFGKDYADYCAQVNRVLPSLRNLHAAFAGLSYDWKSAIRKDLSTLAGLLEGLILLPVWRAYFLDGWAAAQAAAQQALPWSLGVGILYGFLVYAKARRKFFY